MEIENNTSYYSFNIPDYSIGIGENDSEFSIVNYGDVSGKIESDIFQLGTPIVTSLAGTMGYPDFSPNTTFNAKATETSSVAYIGTQKPYWFLNDKTNMVIVFPSPKLPFFETTDACSLETKIDEISSGYKFIKVYTKIGKFANYPENWDSYGAKIIDKD